MNRIFIPLVLLVFNGCIFDRIQEEYRYEYTLKMSSRDTVLGLFTGDTIYGMNKYPSDSILFHYYFYQVLENVSDGNHGYNIYFIAPPNIQNGEIKINNIETGKIFLELLCDECIPGFKKVISGNININKEGNGYLCFGNVTYRQTYTRKEISIKFKGIFEN